MGERYGRVGVSDRRAVFLDRDGVINALVWDPTNKSYESPYKPADVALLAGVPEAIRTLAERGFLTAVVSNQPAAAKGVVTLDELREVHERVVTLLADAEVTVDGYRYCLHHPDGSDPELTRECECRKPAAGMILDAARELDIDLSRSWLVGDSDRDIVAGERAGCRTVLVECEQSAHRRAGKCNPDLTAANLAEAVSEICQLRSSPSANSRT